MKKTPEGGQLECPQCGTATFVQDSTSTTVGYSDDVEYANFTYKRDSVYPGFLLLQRLALTVDFAAHRSLSRMAKYDHGTSVNHDPRKHIARRDGLVAAGSCRTRTCDRQKSSRGAQRETPSQVLRECNDHCVHSDWARTAPNVARGRGEIALQVSTDARTF